MINASGSQVEKLWLETVIIGITFSLFAPLVISVYISNEKEQENLLMKRYRTGPVTSIVGLVAPISSIRNRTAELSFLNSQSELSAG